MMSFVMSERGRLCWRCSEISFIFFYASPLNLGAFSSNTVLSCILFFFFLFYFFIYFFKSTTMTQEKAGPCSLPCRPHWMRLSWAVINLGCPIIPLYLFNGCYLPSSEGLSCWSRPRMRGVRRRSGWGGGGGGWGGVYGWRCRGGIKPNPDRGG